MAVQLVQRMLTVVVVVVVVIDFAGTLSLALRIQVAKHHDAPSSDSSSTVERVA